MADAGGNKDSVPLHRNGWIKIVIALVLIGCAPLQHGLWGMLQLILGALYFCLGLVLDPKWHLGDKIWGKD